MSYQRRISPKQLAAAGWTRHLKDGFQYMAQLYKHTAGWELSHCGHPTALYPWVLLSPKGQLILTGAKVSGNPEFGTAWPTMGDAVAFVSSLAARQYE